MAPPDGFLIKHEPIEFNDNMDRTVVRTSASVSEQISAPFLSGDLGSPLDVQSPVKSRKNSIDTFVIKQSKDNQPPVVVMKEVPKTSTTEKSSSISDNDGIVVSIEKHQTSQSKRTRNIYKIKKKRKIEKDEEEKNVKDVDTIKEKMNKRPRFDPRRRTNYVKSTEMPSTTKSQPEKEMVTKTSEFFIPTPMPLIKHIPKAEQAIDIDEDLEDQEDFDVEETTYRFNYASPTLKSIDIEPALDQFEDDDYDQDENAYEEENESFDDANEFYSDVKKLETIGSFVPTPVPLLRKNDFTKNNDDKDEVIKAAALVSVADYNPLTDRPLEVPVDIKKVESEIPDEKVPRSLFSANADIGEMNNAENANEDVSVDRSLRIIPLTRRIRKKPKIVPPARPATPRIVVHPVRGQIPKKVRLFYPQRKVPPPPPVPTTPYTTAKPRLQGYDLTLKALEEQKNRVFRTKPDPNPYDEPFRKQPDYNNFDEPFTPNPRFEDNPLKPVKTENEAAAVEPFTESSYGFTIPDFPQQPSLLDNLNLEFGKKLNSVSNTERATRLPTPTFQNEYFTPKPIEAKVVPSKDKSSIHLLEDDNKWHAVSSVTTTTTTPKAVTIRKDKPLKTIDDYNYNQFATITDYDKGYNEDDSDIGKLLVEDPYQNTNYPEEVYEYVDVERLDYDSPTLYYDDKKPKKVHSYNQFSSPEIEFNFEQDHYQRYIPSYDQDRIYDHNQERLDFSNAPYDEHYESFPIQTERPIERDHNESPISPYEDFQVPGSPTQDPTSFYEQPVQEIQYKREIIQSTPRTPYREDFTHHRMPKVNYVHPDEPLPAPSQYRPPLDSPTFFNQDYFEDIDRFDKENARSRKLELPAIATDNFPHIVEHISTYGRSLSISDDLVDFGAATGGNGAFGWYSDHPIREGYFS